MATTVKQLRLLPIGTRVKLKSTMFGVKINKRITRIDSYSMYVSLPYYVRLSEFSFKLLASDDEVEVVKLSHIKDIIKHGPKETTDISC